MDAVILVLGAGEKFFVIVGGVIESAAIAIEVILDHDLGQVLSLLEPAGIAAGIVQAKQTMDEEGIIVEIAVDLGRRCLARRGPVGSQQSTLGCPEALEDEIRRPDCRINIFLSFQNLARGGETGDHLAVPGGEQFGIQKRVRPL